MKTMKKTIFLIAACAIFVFAVEEMVEATDYNDAASGNWGTSTTWSPEGIPDSACVRAVRSGQW